MLKRPRLRFLCVVACLATAFVVLTATLLSAGATAQTQSRANVIVVKTVYRAWNGDLRRLHIVYPAGYSELRPGERLPLVIALHGAGGGANCDTSFGKTPARYRFVVACLEGQGAATKSFSYGAPGQIRDQLRLPTLVHLRLPHLPLDPNRVIIVGASMGGLEALLAADLDPQLFAAVVALDAPVDLAAHYQNVAPRGEPNLKTKAMLAECGGTPELVADCYAMRSPLARMTRFGDTRIPLIMWWSSRDSIAGSEDGAPAYLAAMQTNFPSHPIYARIGAWEHGRALWSHGHLWLRDALALATANPQRRGADFG